MKYAYITKNFHASTMDMIDLANQIIEEYAANNLSLTLRQIYYQFVSRDWFPESWADPKTGSTNNIRSYNKLQSYINDARLAGLIDWDAIVDRTRHIRRSPSWDSPRQILLGAASQFKLDLWENQEYRPRVWIEKDALVGVIEAPCARLRVPFYACRGYNSQSNQHEQTVEMRDEYDEGLQPVVIHLGDHDPSGIDMTRDIEDRFAMFEASGIIVERIALNFDQVQEYNPPPNFAKESDSRFQAYREQYGESSWELDALDPLFIQDLVTNTIDDYIDWDKWEEDSEKEQEHKENLRKVAYNFDELAGQL